MKRMFIPEKTVFYIEADEQVGTIQNLENRKRAYVNADTIEVIRHLIQGNSLDSFFPVEIPQKERSKLILQSKSVLRELIVNELLTENRPTHQGLIKKVRANPPLRVVFIELTKKCNLRCKHCYVPNCSDYAEHANDSQMTFAKICDLISQVDELGGNGTPAYWRRTIYPAVRS